MSTSSYMEEQEERLRKRDEMCDKCPYKRVMSKDTVGCEAAYPTTPITKLPLSATVASFQECAYYTWRTEASLRLIQEARERRGSGERAA